MKPAIEGQFGMKSQGQFSTVNHANKFLAQRDCTLALKASGIKPGGPNEDTWESFTLGRIDL